MRKQKCSTFKLTVLFQYQIKVCYHPPQIPRPQTSPTTNTMPKSGKKRNAEKINDDIDGSYTKSSQAAGKEEVNKATKERKRKRSSASSSSTPQQTSADRAIFNGLILAVSTLESKMNDTDKEDNIETYNNYKTLTSIIKSNGATISPQVHKRVHYLVCTQQALNNLTQRVRQALKRNVEIIDVDWIKQCVGNGSRVGADNYLLNDVARELIKVKENENVSVKTKDGYESDIPDENAAGWSEPIELDCCCVCHENGDDNCPWCTDCNLNKKCKASE